MVIVVDTSAWVELFRGSRHPAAEKLKDLLRQKADLAVTEVVLMEVLAGAQAVNGLLAVRSQLAGLPILRLEGTADFEDAARIYRACRAAGETIRSQLDCLIAVPTIRHGASLLHNDRDFEKIARHATLKIEPIDQRPPRKDSRRVKERKGRWRRPTPRRERAPA